MLFTPPKLYMHFAQYVEVPICISTHLQRSYQLLPIIVLLITSTQQKVMGARVLEFLFWEGASGATTELVMRAPASCSLTIVLLTTWPPLTDYIIKHSSKPRGTDYAAKLRRIYHVRGPPLETTLRTQRKYIHRNYKPSLSNANVCHGSANAEP